MRGQRALRGAALAWTLLGLIGCPERPAEGTGDAGGGTGHGVETPLAVRASTGAAQWLVAALGGAGVTVAPVAPAGASAAAWQPDSAAVADLQRADLLVLNGAGLEDFAATVSLPASRVLDLAAPHRARWLFLPTAVHHSHGPGGAHTHQGADPFLWLDPDLLAAQATAVHDALARRRPQQAPALAEGLAGVRAQVEAWRGELAQVTSALAGGGLLSNHPGYAYLARSQGWDLRHISAEAGAAEIRAVLAEGPAHVLLTPTAMPAAVTARLQREFGIEVVVFGLGDGPNGAPGEPMRSWRRATVALAAALAALPHEK